jgi:cell division protein FtsQ
LKKVKKIAIITLWSLLAAGLLVSMGFVNKEQESLLCKSLDIRVNQDRDLYFLNKMDVADLIHARGDSIVNQPKATVKIVDIEKALKSHENIADARVYMTIDGKVKVEVKQRRPLVRIINAVGDSYYLDDEGKLMPLSDNYTAKVVIANGNIFESYARNYMRSIKDIAKDEKARKATMFDELYAMGMYIDADPFWKAQIKQIYINDDKDMELVPLAGNQRIIFGDTAAMDEKFNKLLTFYQQGLNTTGWWNKYSIINLKFKNQIVCTKKI